MREVWRTASFRLSAIYGLIFAVGAAALLLLVYANTDAYLNRRVDRILTTEAAALSSASESELTHRIESALALNGGRINVFALFGPRHDWRTGNLHAWPAALGEEGRPIEVRPTAAFRWRARLMARRLPSGAFLVVGRDVELSHELRVIIAQALFWSGLLIVLMGVGLGVALSVQPLRRLQAIRVAAEDIAAGDLKRRVPQTGRGDELDVVASTVNAMVADIERLMTEVKSATDMLAHDLRTPLTRARAHLYRLQQADDRSHPELARVIAEVDAVLERFRAIMRLSELESRERRAAFAPVRLADVAYEAVELYRPLAEAADVDLALAPSRDAPQVNADAKLLFEAVSNLIDNAVKFTGAGGRVRVTVGSPGGEPRLTVCDNGPGIPEEQRAAVLQRFYRSETAPLVPGSGLGLSFVSAIARLHDAHLRLRDASPGLSVTLAWPTGRAQQTDAPGRVL